MRITTCCHDTISTTSCDVTRYTNLTTTMTKLMFKGIILLVLYLTLDSVGGCPRSCRCGSSKIVYCHGRNLTTVPYGIPTNTETLHIQDNDVINRPVTDENLSKLRNLRELNMYQNHLTSVPGGLPTSLEVVSLRNNRIRYIGKNSLKNMKVLRELSLDGNIITNFGLSSLTFSDTINLEVLVLADNLLTSLPGGLPSSLRVLRLGNNRIKTVPESSIRNLVSLKVLDLSNNRINQKFLPGFEPLISVTKMILDNNKLTEIPRKLPANLKTLSISHNRIKYIYNHDDLDKNIGSLTGLHNLMTLDISSNILESVQSGSFEGLPRLLSVSLHGNHWACDCNLDYFKQWISRTTSVLSSEHNIRCKSPPRFADVTINSIDSEALKCEKESLKLLKSTSQSLIVEWTQISRDPPYVEKRLFYGPLLCQNCSNSNVIHGDVTDLVEKYSLLDVTSQLQNDVTANITIDRLLPQTDYLICYYDNKKNIKDIPIGQCVQTSTNQIPTTAPPAHVTKQSSWPPLWIILVCCVTVLLCFIGVVVFVIMRQRRTMKKRSHVRYPATSLGNREDYYFPESYLPGFTYAPAPPINSFNTNLSDRTYMECGDADATTEFDVMIKPGDITSPKHVATSRYEDVTIPSLPRSNPSITTNHTTTTLQSNDAAFIDDTSTTMTSRLRHETGIFV